VPYITPPETPEGRDCRALLIPASSDWLAIFGGALTELIYKYNWEQIDGMTVDDAIQVATTVINGFYEGCVASGCNQPGGYGILRVNPEGHVEQLIDGEWVEPQGDNAFPAIPARTEPTPDERKCLAAANAANVLQIGYESLADSFSEGLTQAEAIINLIAAFAVLWFWFAPILNGLVLLLAGFLELVINAFEYVTVDAWDATFTDLVRCALYECAQDDGEIVTFDFQCVLTKLSDKTIGGDWTEIRLRAAVQLTYLLYILGGADFLNQAGGTTAITSADCSDCEQSWCITNDATDNADDWSVQFGGDWVDTVGWKPTHVPYGGNYYNDLEIGVIFDAPFSVTAVEIRFDYEKGSFGDPFFNAWLIAHGLGTYFDQSHLTYASGTFDGTDLVYRYEFEAVIDRVFVELICSITSSGVYDGDLTLKAIYIEGTGEKPVKTDWPDCP